MLVETLQTAMAADAGMQAFLGQPSQRPDSMNGIFPMQAIDQPTMPYVVLSQVSGQPLQTSIDGTGAFTSERWRFSCHGTKYKNAKTFAKYVRKFLLTLNGNYPTGKTFIQGAWCKMEADESESLGKGTLFTTHVDFEFEYQDLDT